MATVHDAIDDRLRALIEAQNMFFVASAPLAAEGHVNVSPKGLDCLRVLAPDRVAYLDLTGSGNETSAHLRENGRITLMFCAFQGPPNILRLYGTGHTVLEGDDDWDHLRAHFGDLPGARQIVVVGVTRVQTSCGFAVPRYTRDGDRDQLVRWALSKGPEGVAAYWAQKNMVSIDGLPTAHAR